MSHDAPQLALGLASREDGASLRVAGVDEAGRGPLAGPVVVAAVVFAPGRTPINGLDDSKQLTAQRREVLYERIVERAIAWHIEFVTHEEIDRLNIYHATMAGMSRSIACLHHRVDVVRIDGNALPRGLPCAAEAWVNGDARDRSIMAASILAKVSRDRYMQGLHERFPLYRFDQHKGYSTPVHLSALREHGPCPEHRRSFAPVQAACRGDAAPPAIDELPLAALT